MDRIRDERRQRKKRKKKKKNSQNPGQKHRRNPNFFRPTHLQLPNNMLRHNQNRDIRRTIQKRRSKINSINIQTLPLPNPRFPKLVDGRARENEEEDGDAVEDEIEPDQGMADPVGGVADSGGAEYSEVLEEDGEFDGEDYEAERCQFDADVLDF